MTREFLKLLCTVTLAAAVMIAAPKRAAARPHPSSARLPLCKVPDLDTTSWLAESDADLHVRFLRPPGYERKDWSSARLPNSDLSRDWWHRNGPVWSFTFSRRTKPTDSATYVQLRRFAGYSECTLRTGAGDAAVRLFRNGTAGYGGKAVVLYDILAEWPPDATGHVLHFESVSRDDARSLQQLVMLRTVRAR